MVREMVGGCCVCLDERGWNENPLVYCDGTGCSVAVHQACYGIVKVPSGPWFCCKCRSQERVARVKCELCPSKEGALKRTDTGGWAHVVCALYIPEVRFGNVSTMEPIVFSSVPHERFLKTCHLCEESGRESKTANGACMNCHKTGCKLSFHVTCAQSKRQLCEEASVNGHVQYVGYCTIHWQKRFKQPIPSSTSLSESDIKKVGREKKRSRSDSTSSTNSLDNTKPKKLSKPSEPKSITSDNTTSDEATATTTQPKKSSLKVPYDDGVSDKKLHSLTGNGLSTNDKSKRLSSPLNTPAIVHQYKRDSPQIDVVTTPNNEPESEQEEEVEEKEEKVQEIEEKKCHQKQEDLNVILEHPTEPKKRKQSNKKEKLKKSGKKEKDKDTSKKKKEKQKNTDKKEKSLEKKRKYPQPSQLGLFENGKVSSWESVTPKSKDTPDNFQEFLEHQWSESAQFLLSKAEHFDVASLLNCLHQLKTDNTRLEKKLMHLESRRDRLLGVNARLASSITTHSTEQTLAPLSAMLSKLNDETSCSTTPSSSSTTTTTTTTQQQKTNKKHKKTKEDKNNNPTVSSPDLALLAATSAKLECNAIKSNSSSKTSTHTSRLNTLYETYNIPLDEKPSISSPKLVEPNVHIPSVVTSTSMMNGSIGTLFGTEVFTSNSTTQSSHKKQRESHSESSRQSSD